jgi:hypothetical protein
MTPARTGHLRRCRSGAGNAGEFPWNACLALSSPPRPRGAARNRDGSSSRLTHPSSSLFSALLTFQFSRVRELFERLNLHNNAGGRPA